MKKGYWVVAYRSIPDQTVVMEYGKLAGPAITAAGGKALVRTSDAVEPHEAGLKQRTVLIEFESYQKALAAYQTPAYQAALKALGNSVERDLRIVEGLE